MKKSPTWLPIGQVSLITQWGGISPSWGSIGRCTPPFNFGKIVSIDFSRSLYLRHYANPSIELIWWGESPFLFPPTLLEIRQKLGSWVDESREKTGLELCGVLECPSKGHGEEWSDSAHKTRVMDSKITPHRTKTF